MTLWWLLPSVGLIAWALAGLLRRYALAHRLLDIPNARSSHQLPTLRGGGAAIVAAFFLGIGLLELGTASAVSTASTAVSMGSGMVAGGGSVLFLALLGALAVALLGFLDDHGHIAARWRLLGHFAAAGWALYWLNGLPPMTALGVEIELGWLGHFMALLYMVWLLNLYNFMDGINGIASVEAICVCLGAVALMWVSGMGDTAAAVGVAQPALILTAAVAGFLVWNFPRARMFMGDVGSGFIGLALGILSIQAAWLNPGLFWCWLILLGVFIGDATLTLLRRLLRGEPVHQAHRSHAYQFAARRHGGHEPVTWSVLAINLCWLLPLAICVAMGVLDGLVGVLVAYAPLLVLAVRYSAGRAEA